MGGYPASITSHQWRGNRIVDDPTPYVTKNLGTLTIYESKFTTWNPEDEKFQKDGRDLADTREFQSIYVWER